MIVKKIAIAIGVMSLATVYASAQDPISQRQAAMKSAGAAAGVSGKMLKGEMDYDAAVALDALTKISEVAQTFGDYFPEGSETGGKTKASPKIWEDPEGWQAALAKFEMDSAAAVAAAPADLDAFKAAFGAIGANCGTCHKAYRLSDN